jgi:N-methylhydantoinase B
MNQQWAEQTGGAVLKALDPIQVEVLWNRLIGIVEEQATVLIRTAFTNIVSDSGDLSAGIFDTRGNMIAQAVTGTPGHINSMAIGQRHFLTAYPAEMLQPGDVLISNDPHQFSGHLNDFTVSTPIYRGERLVAYFASTCHALDVGGRGFGPEGRDAFEEGLYIPISKYYIAGKPNEELIKLLRANVRTPNEVLGDLHAQVAANNVGGQRLLETMEEFGLESLEVIADEIITRSECAMREAIRRLPDGEYSNSLTCDGWDEPITIQAKVIVDGDELEVDFTGSSPEVPYGINVVLNYTIAYTTYALKAAICPEVPNNEGSFRPVRVHAPKGSILNCGRSAPVAARHIVGHFAPECVLGALSRVLPERALAEGANTIWNIQAAGTWPSGAPFHFVAMMAGGMGARACKDGLSAAIFPSGIRGTPVEIVESAAPLMITRKELRCDSGGPGTYRGGLGQEVHLRVRSDSPLIFTAMFDRTRFPARGLRGGKAGALGEVQLDDGTRLAPKGKHVIPAERTLILRLPGGGGYGSPYARPPERVLQDVRNGFVSRVQAETAYGVVIDEQNWTVDSEATARCRGAKVVEKAAEEAEGEQLQGN